MASVKVAVRVRPFNQRELDMGCQKIIEMDGKKTRIQNIKVADQKQVGEALREKYRDFTFDYSYWSFNSQDEEFASQEQVFLDLGRDVVDNAFQGYNACVFAYGQTGSGKTHTMMGSPASQEAQGLIPRICKDMFNRMNQGKENGITYRTEVSYLEIYNERVKDLLKKNQTHSLKVREHNKYGIYVEDLSKHLVMDYADIQDLMERGNASRTTACTNMNDVSSRSHAIFTMTFVQARFVGDMPSETVSKIHLVDLAGSERADASGATGQRLKEGGHINKSLVTLGSVISALADAAQSKKPNAGHIPYRNSVLTWLLKDSLGGNAKTIMIAAISPADVNYGETLSTLRYANRAKNIINKPTINEDSNVKLIRDLRAEINKLKSMLGTTVEPSDSVLEQIHEKEAKEKVLTEEWTEKWKETQTILMEQKDLALRKAGTGVVLDSQMPHLIGIDDDLLSTGITLYHLKEGETQIGSEEDGQYDIMLRGPGLEPNHCSISLSNGVATLMPTEGATCLVNGLQIDKPTRLSQGCVIRLGTNMFRYNDPAEAEKLRREGPRANLGRQSVLSRSTTDLAWSSESLHFGFTSGEENAVLEEKRKQLEAEEARLQKESQELLSQKAQLEQQKNQYQLLQQEKEEAWKAEQVNKSTTIQIAQKELEEKRQKLEFEYAAHRRRLAEDWKRLEQQEQDTLSSLKSKEADLKKRKEFLEMEVEREVDQIESEAQKIEALREQLADRERNFEQFQGNLAAKLKDKLSRPKEEVKRLLSMEDTQFENFIVHQAAAIEQWKKETEDDLAQQKDILQEHLKSLTEEATNCKDDSQRAELQRELETLKIAEETLKQKLDALTVEYSSKKEQHALLQEALADPRAEIHSKKQECLAIETDISNGMQTMVTSENKIAKIESDLVLIADQEKLICNQLAHIDKSKQKLLTIIEHSTEETSDDLVKKLCAENDSDATRNQGPLSPLSPSASSNHSSSGDLSPSKFDSPKASTPVNLQDVKLSVEEATNELKRLVDRINDQKTVVLECLENDCDKEELNKHMAVLQDLRNKYLEIECILDRTTRRRWLYDDEDSSTFDFDKGDEYGIGVPIDSDQEDSEAHSSVMDHDDQMQILIEQGVERRLREIFEQLKTGQKPNLLFKDGLLNRRSMRGSMPNDLNHAYGSGSDDDGSSGSPRPIPRSISMNSTSWAAATSGVEVIPGLLEISIPTFVVRGTGGNTHYEYEVCITTPNEKYSILRRYKKFRELYLQMEKKYGSKISDITFPPRRLFGGRSESLAKERRILLENFVQNLVRVCATLPLSPLYSFITKPTNVDVRQTLISFSSFFEKGFFECTKYGTS